MMNKSTKNLVLFNICGGHVYLTVVSSLKSRLYDRTVTSKRDIKLV